MNAAGVFGWERTTQQEAKVNAGSSIQPAKEEETGNGREWTGMDSHGREWTGMDDGLQKRAASPSG